MRDIKIYLHTNTTKLQAFIHTIAAVFFITKSYKLPLNQNFYLFWHVFYLSFGSLLSAAAIFQVFVQFKSRQVAAILNILAGVVLVVESMIQITDSTKQFYLLSFGTGILFIMAGIFEDRINKIPYIIFTKNKIHGRRSLLSYFSYSWDTISDISFKRNRVKIFTHDGEVIRYQVARQSAGGILFKSAEYSCHQMLEKLHANAQPVRQSI